MKLENYYSEINKVINEVLSESTLDAAKNSYYNAEDRRKQAEDNYSRESKTKDPARIKKAIDRLKAAKRIEQNAQKRLNVAEKTAKKKQEKQSLAKKDQSKKTSTAAKKPKPMGITTTKKK